MPTKAQLEAQVADLTAEIEHIKDSVRTKAYEVAEEQGWCLPGVASTLESLEIKPRITTFEGNIVIDLPVVIEMYLTDQSEEPLGWLHSCVENKSALMQNIVDFVAESFDEDIRKVTVDHRPTINFIDGEGNSDERAVQVQ